MTSSGRLGLAQRRAQAHHRIPSLAATVLRDGQIAWECAVGLAVIESEQPASIATQYRIGSITKTFTAAAVMRLRDEGRLSLEDAVGEHVPGVPGAAVTLRRLLSHMSGLQREPVGRIWETYVFPEAAELLTQSSSAEQVLPPGLAFHYSNLAYSILGEVIARRARRPYREHIDQIFLGPLGLSNTTWQPRAPIATGYFVHPHTDRPHAMVGVDIAGSAPAGQLWSTTGDLARWGAFLMTPEPAILSPESAEEMRSVQAMVDPDTWQAGYGLGLALLRRGDRVFSGHEGGMPGFVAGLVFSPKEKVAAAILANIEGGAFNPARLAIELASTAIDVWPVAPVLWRPSGPVPPSVEPVLGSWWSEGTEFVFRYRAGHLEAIVPAWPQAQPAVFEPAGVDRYRTTRGRERGEWLEVVRNDSGAVIKIYWATYPFTRHPSA